METDEKQEPGWNFPELLIICEPEGTVGLFYIIYLD